MNRVREFETYASLIYKEYPKGRQVEMAGWLRQAYARVDSLIEETGWLRTVDSRVTRGHLIRSASHDIFMQQTKRAQWPHTPAVQRYVEPGGEYLEIRGERSILSIHRVKYIEAYGAPAFPRPSRFLDNDRLVNDPSQFCFAFDRPPESNQVPFRLVLLYGGDERPEFAYIAVPHPKRRRCLWYSPNLMNLPFEVAVPATPVESTERDVRPTFKPDLAARKTPTKSD